MTGERGLTGATGPQGPAGEPGVDGKDGAAATIKVGTVTTLAPGSKATVSNRGTANAAVLDFGIPRGADGEGGGGSGEAGADGGYYTPSVDESTGILNWEASKSDMPAVPSAYIRGPKGDTGSTGATGPAGSNGAPGKDGTSVTVKSVSNSSADGGSNVVTFSDGKTLTVKNGSKGSPGDPGTPGYTPVKGTDYWTAADRQSIVNDVVAALPKYNGEVVSV